MTYRCAFKAFNECACGTECAAQPSARLIDLNRRHAAAVTSHGRAWIAFIGAMIVGPALLFAVVTGAGQQHQINLDNQESRYVSR